ncbi:MAG: hypothetical protein IPK00_19005 [Deltaproteobacteria bacterium]|nr:hypothetical protein [Deltaproteobacteria bacterium]
MFETLIGLGIVTLFCVLAWAAKASAEALLVGGLGLAALGFAYGIPTALVYHWLLHRSLTRAGRLPERWWLSPTAHHEKLPIEDRPRVLLWAAIGGSGFLVVVLGILLTSLGLWRARAA